MYMTIWMTGEAYATQETPRIATTMMAHTNEADQRNQGRGCSTDGSRQTPSIVGTVPTMMAICIIRFANEESVSFQRTTATAEMTSAAASGLPMRWNVPLRIIMNSVSTLTAVTVNGIRLTIKSCPLSEK